MDAEELLKRYAAGERDFSGLNLRGAKLNGVDPSIDDLGAYNKPYENGIAADLSGINLSEADLTDAELSGTNLSNANLSRANLNRAGLGQCNLTNTNFRGANLTEAYLSCAELDGTDMREANLFYAEISQTYFGADVRGAKNVNTVNFTGTPVRGLVLEDGTIIDSDHDW